MKITLFIGSLYGGGAERVTCNLANYLVSKGHDVEILTVSETKESYELVSKVKTKTLLTLSEKSNKVLDIIRRLHRFWRYLSVTKNDVYIVMLPKTTILLLAFKCLTKAKIIAAERVDPAAYSKTIATLLKALAKKADGFVFQTEDARAWYGECVFNIKTEVIPNAINTKFIGRDYKGIKRKYIAGAGRLDSQKNFPLLINAFAKIASKYPDYNLVIYGQGKKKEALEKQISDLGLGNRVLLPGNIQNIADEMEQNSMFALSSNFEGMPNALMEAMALGLPCISTDCPCGGPRFLIQDGVNGLLVPVNNVASMAEAMKKLLDNPSYADELGNEARNISERLAPEKIYGQWENFIKRVVEEQRD